MHYYKFDYSQSAVQHIKEMYLMVETDCLQFCIKKETEGSSKCFTLRQNVSGKARLCEVRDASARPGGSLYGA